MRQIDMHFHTKLSDGKKENDEIIKILNPKKVDLVIATEHDIQNQDFRNKVNNLWINTWFWVEVSMQDYTDNKSMHILHYSSEINSLLNIDLETIRNSRELKNIKHVEKLISSGFDINYNEMINYYSSIWVNVSNLVSYHIAEYIFKNEKNIKIAQDITKFDKIWVFTFYKEFLKRWGEFNNIWWAEIWNYEFDIRNINDRKLESSIFSLAHPNHTFKDSFEYFEEKVDKLVWFWLNAIEVNPQASKKWLDLINYVRVKHDLIITFWSDCHFQNTFDWKHGQLFEFNKDIDKSIVDDNFERIKDKLGLINSRENYASIEALNTENYAVMIGRLNPPHIGHLRIIRQALRENDKLVLFLGSANIVNEKNPFSFDERKEILEILFKDEIASGRLIISYLDDVWDDGLWVENLWNKLRDFTQKENINAKFYGWDFNEDRAILAISENEDRLNINKTSYMQIRRDHFALPNWLDLSATNLRNVLNSWDYELARKFLDPKIADIVIKKWEEK